jgi:rod shape-determining protein MreD
MKKNFFLLLLGFALVFFQIWLLPALLPFRLKPGLFLLVVVYIGIYAEFSRGAVHSLFLGWFQDVYAGNSMGLYGLVFLIIYFIVRYVASRINAEAPGTFYYLVLFATLGEAVLVCFFQAFFTEPGALWSVVFQNLLQQVLLNLVFAFLLLRLLQWLKGKTQWVLPVPGRPQHGDI